MINYMKVVTGLKRYPTYKSTKPNEVSTNNNTQRPQPFQA